MPSFTNNNKMANLFSIPALKNFSTFFFFSLLTGISADIYFMFNTSFFRVICNSDSCDDGSCNQIGNTLTNKCGLMRVSNLPSNITGFEKLNSFSCEKYSVPSYEGEYSCTLKFMFDLIIRNITNSSQDCPSAPINGLPTACDCAISAINEMKDECSESVSVTNQALLAVGITIGAVILVCLLIYNRQWLYECMGNIGSLFGRSRGENNAEAININTPLLTSQSIFDTR